MTESRIVARMEADAAKLAAIRAAKAPATAQASRTSHSSGIELEQDEEAEAEQSDQRVVIKFFYEHLGSPPEEEWKGRYGTVSRIRLRMGDAAPTPDTVYRTLVRLNAGDERHRLQAAQRWRRIGDELRRGSTRRAARVQRLFADYGVAVPQPSAL